MSFQHPVNSQRTRELASLALTNAAEPIFVTDANLRVVFVNQAFVDATGHPAESVIGRLLPLFANHVLPNAVARDLHRILERDGCWRGEVINRRKNGEEYAEFVSLSTIQDVNGRMVNIVGTAHEIAAFRQNPATSDSPATRNPVTRLPDRRTLAHRYDVERRQDTKSESDMAVLILDLDNFKAINHSLGHSAGDMLLHAVGKRFRNSLDDHALLAHQGGDTFMVLLPNLPSPRDAAAVATRLMESLNVPFRLQGREVFTSTSVGISVYPQDGQEFDEIAQRAESAAHRAKQLGKNMLQYYSKELSASANEYFESLNALYQALSREEFVLHYQPIIDMENGRLHSLEALARWNRPGHGLVGPAEFLPAAERSGIINSIGEWLLKEACRQGAEWKRRRLLDGRIMINLSARQFQRRHLAHHIQAVLNETGFDPRSLKIEITEGTLTENREQSATILEELRAMGIETALDDFGTGYSSLTHLKRFPLDTLKIDRSFIANLPGDRDDAMITRTIINMARTLDKSVIAEGVETAEQRQFLLEHGCTLGQGFLFSEPLPAHEAEVLMAMRAPLLPDS